MSAPAGKVLFLNGDHVRRSATIERWLQGAGFHVTMERSRDCGPAAKPKDYDVVLVGLLSLEPVGLTGVTEQFSKTSGPRVIVVGERFPSSAVVRAVKCGAFDVFDSSTTAAQLIAAVAGAAGDRRNARQSSNNESASVAERWAGYVMQAAVADVDVHTLEGWAELVGASYTTLAQCCRLVGVKPHDARDLARALFAMIQGARQGCPPAVLLNIADGRTLRTFVNRAGCEFHVLRSRAALQRFFCCQTFAVASNAGVKLLASLLAAKLSFLPNESAADGWAPCDLPVDRLTVLPVRSWRSAGSSSRQRNQHRASQAHLQREP